MGSTANLFGTVLAIGVADRIINSRRFNNYEYKLYGHYPTKAKASAAARARRDKGYSARVRKESKGYSVWVRR